MKVSVVIPALNEEGNIEKCLKSIRRQAQEVELILIDNGSEDNTPEIARKYCDQVHIKPGYSLAEMRDFGARAATGDIIVTTDADCIAYRRYYFYPSLEGEGELIFLRFRAFWQFNRVFYRLNLFWA